MEARGHAPAVPPGQWVAETLMKLEEDLLLEPGEYAQPLGPAPALTAELERRIQVPRPLDW